MTYYQSPSPIGQSYLRTALANIHRDPTWWRKILGGGACMLTIVGWPFASGLVVENMENATKGYPTPLPPSIDLGTRYIIGIFALIIDFVLYLLPLFIGGSLLICAMLAILFGTGGGEEANTTFRLVAGVIGGLAALFELGVFVSGAAPIGRLRYVEEGRVEDAIGGQPVRDAMRSSGRRLFIRARLASLPFYLPFILLALLAWGLLFVSFPGQVVVLLVLLWLMLSSLLYAHIAVGQIYALAQQEVQRAEMEARMSRRR